MTDLQLYGYSYLDFKSADIFKMSNNYYFNPGMVRIKNNEFIFSCRKMYTFITEFAKLNVNEIIPGNDSDCKNISKDDIGKNYVWNNWENFYFNKKGIRNTEEIIFFKGEYNECNNNFTLSLLKEESLVSFDYIKSKNIRDTRLTYIKDCSNNNNDNVLIAYDSDFLKVNLIYIKDKILTRNSYNYRMLYGITDKDNNITPLCLSLKENKNINQELDKEELDKETPEYIYKKLDCIKYLIWFYPKGLCAGTDTNPREYSHELLIEYNHGFSGEGSHLIKDDKDLKQKNQKKFKEHYGRLPSFSFGTPNLYINYNEIPIAMIGCGHTKISNVYDYLPNSNIQKFKKQTHIKMRELFGDKYKAHYGTGKAPNDCYGYIYLLYFYILYKDENTDEYHMKLSDSYLPVNLSEKENNKYKFSLVFPMGIADYGEDILVSCGEGDFYSILLKFKINNIIDACRHDLREINMDNYKFKYLVKNKDYSFKTLDNL